LRRDLRVSLGEGRLGLIERVGYSAVWGRRRLGVQEPAPFHHPMDRLSLNPADPRFINDGIVDGPNPESGASFR